MAFRLLVGLLLTILFVGQANASDDSALSVDELVEKLASAPQVRQTRGFRVAAADAEVVNDGEGQISLPGVTFATNSDVLSPEAKAILGRVSQAISSPGLKGRKFLIEGHTDATGSSAHNQRLSQRRAESARRYLVDQGVEGARLFPLGKGESELAIPVSPEAAANRRVEIETL